ncbi:MAG: hypothetical protein KDA84_15230, partial [Planctomycetaceae bacterium]|nr:hypothetical protein [Planctomycetaceae bacterium]
MLLTHWLSELFSRRIPRLNWRKPRRHPGRHRRTFTQVETLEHRTLLTVFDITNTSDDAVDTTVDTLREAVIAANDEGTNAGADTINLGAGTFTLSLMGASEDAATTGDLDITSEITIQGAGAGQTIIDATGLGDRVLHVLASGNLTLDGVTITGGTATGTSPDHRGGGIYGVTGGSAVTITNSVITGNFADVA